MRVKGRAGEGFTLIELLVVIIIIGILAAIALPSFLNQANKAKQSEAKTYVGSMNRGQQAYYTEYTRFTGDIGELGIGIEEETENYVYDTTTSTLNSKTAAYSTGIPQTANNADDVLRPYAGNVFLVGANDSLTSVAILCEGDIGTTAPTAATAC